MFPDPSAEEPIADDEEEDEGAFDGVAAALYLFQDMSCTQLEVLGVSIIEGEFPGSSYFAAELDVSIEEANKSAEQAKIPIRFYRE
jgi:hypothetical protein